MQSHLNVDQLVMARDRHRLNRLRKDKKTETAEIEKLFEQSNHKVKQRLARLPKIKLNQDLPVTQYADRLIEAIQKHQVIIVAGETGSGKTTQLPQIAMLAGRGLTGMIGHTQPRRLAARSVSQRIAEEVGEKLGESVGFKIRFNEQGSQDSIVRLMTDGILLAELTNDRFLSKYDTIIIDEAHERSLNIDFIMGYLKQLLPKRPDLKVIVTSATLDVNRFSQYFNDAPIFEVEGRSFPVEVRYRPISELSIIGSDDDEFDDFEENLPRAVVQAVEECFADAEAKGHPEHADILIFASTEQEIRELQETLQKFGPRHTEVLPLYARLALAEQQKIFSPSGKGRRIIIATNVAETALTVPNIRYVIDSGFARISRYNYRSRVQRLPIEAISQAAANQRKGRCGRIAAGVCIRLYSEEDFLSRPEFTEPEIKRTNLASVILQMQSLGLGNLEDFDFIEPPDFRLVNDGRKLLIELGALNERKNELTKVGQMMARMPIDPRLARMIIGGAHFGVLKETLIIVSALAIQDPRERPADKQMQADQKHALFKEADSDFLFYLKLWNTLQTSPDTQSENKRRQFARQHFLSWLRLREWKQTHHQLVELAEGLKLSFNEKGANYENLHRALLTGLLSFIANKTDERNTFMAVRQQKAKVFPASTLHKTNTAWVMAFEMVETSQVYLRTLAKIDPEWILLAARDLLKYHYFEPHWSKKAGIVNAYAQISLFGLIIEPKRMVNFEKVDQPAAHEIFLRDALTTGNLGITPPFLKHNLLKLEEVERVEDKLRRRDLVVDEETIYQFYAEKVPKEIASRRSFEDWRATVEPDHPRFLFVDDDALWMNDRPTTQQFPDYLHNGQLRLAASYRFDPSHDEDGATIKIPVQALAQVDEKQWSWGIPGWRQSLIEALLKALPKDKRRNLVPIPDTAKKLLQGIDAVHLREHLFSYLAFALRGEQITEKDFSFEKIDQYLVPFIKVLDEKGKLIAQGRDLEELKARCRIETHRPVKQQQGEFQSFPESFVFEASQKVTGVVVQQYQALVPTKVFAELDAKDDSVVVVQTFNDQSEAIKQHREGVIRLVHLQLGDLIRQLKKQISKPLALAYSPLGDRAKLEQMLVYATLQVSIQGLPKHADEFQQLLIETKKHFLANGQKVLNDMTEIFTQWQRIRRELLVLDKSIFGRSIDDIEDQLDLMSLVDFVYTRPVDLWQEYPRYLKALLLRLDRLPNNLQRDLAAIDDVDPWMDKVFKFKNDPKIKEMYLMLEELRISLFSQPMKTKMPISPTRLQKLWDRLAIG
ncbi:ATP-dependent RNA helicase HrpA [Acinetobacter haemolyticus]|uniref:ATP-dependent RNA helicase HrpA n=1 Tax=Acinetobacter haemolyticus TaxID=29430 RepID=A0A857IKH0_ACIHA|nr:ATP-dependent RNA helicase HrpA [Acinetobacter haemolyticus]ENW18842.1 ATP-dependent helicase HrpA [Acinetobacter haemolyticus NIPH 261]EPR90494.1 ATP-dependent helicase HrpA [Acinetobacter haemolyticus CIP 64.3 = MTCC 9819]NAR53650.1 ATP-dependent RNA helicase HrpA [Acinetobacter haemolyticus]NAR85433.1 ATP-dependent RNA helicase HrpA [Acinetobacter haemolyticus]NAR89499.1 ATP-dependent RNA helicase HrpA [Acinetobacter haemolyticus]